MPRIFSSSSGATTDASDLTSGTVALARGGTNADLSATGGTGHVLKQASAGANITVGALLSDDLPTAIDAVKIANGSVSNTEFQYLNNVTSPIQTQLNGKASKASMPKLTPEGSYLNDLEIYSSSSLPHYISICSQTSGDIEGSLDILADSVFNLQGSRLSLVRLQPGANSHVYSGHAILASCSSATLNKYARPILRNDSCYHIPAHVDGVWSNISGVVNNSYVNTVLFVSIRNYGTQIVSMQGGVLSKLVGHSSVVIGTPAGGEIGLRLSGYWLQICPNVGTSVSAGVIAELRGDLALA